MEVIRDCNNKNIGCTLLEFQLKSIYSGADVYEADLISASVGCADFSSGGVFLR